MNGSTDTNAIGTNEANSQSTTVGLTERLDQYYPRQSARHSTSCRISQRPNRIARRLGQGEMNRGSERYAGQAFDLNTPAGIRAEHSFNARHPVGGCRFPARRHDLCRIDPLEFHLMLSNA